MMYLEHLIVLYGARDEGGLVVDAGSCQIRCRADVDAILHMRSTNRVSIADRVVTVNF